MSKLIFISGIHGVGKSTLCGELNKVVDMSTTSCSDIIKSNSTYIENSKVVDKADLNQIALLVGLDKLRDNDLLLDGHFCLLGKDHKIIELDYKYFDDIAPSIIINVFADANEIFRRLVKRDGDSIPLEVIEKFQDKESHRAYNYARLRNIPILDYKSGSEISEVLSLIE